MAGRCLRRRRHRVRARPRAGDESHPRRQGEERQARLLQDRDAAARRAACRKRTSIPAAMRSTRDLLRRRLHLVRKRGQLLAHIQNTRAQNNLPDFERRLAYPANREGVAERLPRRQRPQNGGGRSRPARPLRCAHRRPRADAGALGETTRRRRVPSPPICPRHRQGSGTHDPLRDSRRLPVRSRPGIRLVCPAREGRGNSRVARTSGPAAPRWATCI